MTREEKLEKRKNARNWIKIGISVVAGTLVEMFVGAMTKAAMPNVSSGRLAKAAAKAGSFLTGIWLGGNVSNYICEAFDDTMDEIESFEELEEED